MKRLIINTIFILSILFCCSITAYAAEGNEDNLPYVIDDGTTYYESSQDFGSGRKNIVDADNPYTTEPCWAGINGYSYLDEDGNILKYDYDESTDDITIPPAPEGAVKLFKHFKSTFFRNGWVDSANVKLVETENTSETIETEETTEVPEKQNAEELAEMIQQYKGMTVVIVDRSSSMDDFAEDATSEFRELTIVNEDLIKVYVFGKYFKEIKPEEITADNGDVRENEESYDYLADVLNDAKKYNPEHIIVLTDLGVYDGEIDEQPNLKTLDILVPHYGSEIAKERFENIKKSFPNATVKLRLFDEDE